MGDFWFFDKNSLINNALRLILFFINKFKTHTFQKIGIESLKVSKYGSFTSTNRPNVLYVSKGPTPASKEELIEKEQ